MEDLTKLRPCKISVIIPSMRPELIPGLRKTLLRQSFPISEILVIEDNERKGVSWGRNKGIKKATGDWVAFIDDDCRPEEDWLAKLVYGIQLFGADVAGGAYTETDILLRDIRSKKHYPESTQIDTEGYVATGGNIIFSKKCLLDCEKTYGYIFDETMVCGSEDHEFCWRLRKQGVKFVFVPSFPTHLKRINFKNYLSQTYWRGKGIYDLKERMESLDLKPYQKSKIWAQKGNKVSVYLKAILSLTFGPFDINNFSSHKNFFLYWLGEKFKGLGYVVQMFKIKFGVSR